MGGERGILPTPTSITIMLFRSLAITTVFAGLVSAADISPACEAAFTTLFASPDVACLNPSGLAAVFTGGNVSVVPAVNTWLTGFCALDACTNASLATITTAIATGCGPEFGIVAGQTAEAVQFVQTAFPPARKVLCLQHTTTNTLCVTETLRSIEAIVGPLTPGNIQVVFGDASALPPLPASVVCTDCQKQAYNIWKAELPEVVANATAPLTTLCGASFVDGRVPPDITQTARGARLYSRFFRF